jgi:catechol 2,3-dioxygenase-like lactoylglutathione lyase family enzyme
MAILGIDALIYAVEDIKTSTRFFEDFGLRLVGSSAEESRFECRTKTEVKYADF